MKRYSTCRGIRLRSPPPLAGGYPMCDSLTTRLITPSAGSHVTMPSPMIRHAAMATLILASAFACSSEPTAGPTDTGGVSVAGAQSLNSTPDSLLMGPPGSGPVFTPGASVSDSEYRATQAQMRAAWARKQRDMLILSAREGRLGAWGAIKTANETRDKSLIMYLAGRYLFYALLALIVVKFVFFRRR